MNFQTQASDGRFERLDTGSAVVQVFVFQQGRCLGWECFGHSYIFIGRSSRADLVLNSCLVDPIHAAMYSGPYGVTLHNLGLQDSLTVNGDPIIAAPVERRDTVRIGPYLLKIKQLPQFRVQKDSGPSCGGGTAEQTLLRERPDSLENKKALPQGGTAGVPPRKRSASSTSSVAQTLPESSTEPTVATERVDDGSNPVFSESIDGLIADDAPVDASWRTWDPTATQPPVSIPRRDDRGKVKRGFAGAIGCTEAGSRGRSAIDKGAVGLLEVTRISGERVCEVTFLGAGDVYSVTTPRGKLKLAENRDGYTGFVYGGEGFQGKLDGPGLARAERKLCRAENRCKSFMRHYKSVVEHDQLATVTGKGDTYMIRWVNRADDVGLPRAAPRRPAEGCLSA